VVSEKRTVADEDGNISYKVVVGDNSSGVEYRLSEEQGKNLPDNAFITYYGGVVRGDSDIILSGQAVDLTGPFSEWESLNPNFGAANMRRGRVLNRTARSIWFEDGGFYQYHLGFALRLTEGARRRFEKITVNDINIGDEVIYYLSTGEIAVRGIIVGG
jgi:hypothetical protein